MKFVHRRAFHATRSQRRKLEKLDIRFTPLKGLPGEKDPFIWFDVSEDHPNWPILKKLFEQWGVTGLVTTVFSKKEIETARYLCLGSDWHHGYPQPNELEDGYLEATFDLTDYCKCGIGKKQKAPFQMKGEPKWGRRGILQLNWVFDEYFVTPEVWKNVFEPHGIGCRPVINRKDVELETVVQLVVEEEVDIKTEGVPGEVCPDCGRMKYLPWTRGPFPPLTNEPTSAMVKTREYFGSGGRAFKEVIISQALARTFASEKVRGASFWPVAE